MKKIFYSLFFILCSLFFAAIALADSPNSLTVSPSIIRLDLATDKPETVLQYKNNSNNTIELSLSASDVAELEHGYEPAFLDEKNAKNYKYALSSWISFNDNNLVIPPNATESVKIFIDKDKLTPGGHYGSIQAKILNASVNAPVQIQGTLSSLVFVRTNTGKEKESAKIHGFEITRSFFAFPKIFTLRFQNTGDTDLTPYGLVEVKDMFGRNVARGILNEGSQVTLPESIRNYDIEIKPNAFLFPGMYTADFKGHFGKTNQKMEKQIKFFSEGNVPLILLVIILITILVYLKRRSHKAN